MTNTGMTAVVVKRLDRLDTRQEAIVQSVDKLAEVVATNGEMLVQVMDWLQKPTSNDLPDALRALAASVETLNRTMLAFGAELTELGNLVRQEPGK